MKRIPASVAHPYDYSRIVHTLAELYSDQSNESTILRSERSLPDIRHRAKKRPTMASLISVMRITSPFNPFAESLVSYDPNAHRMTFLISLSNTMREVGELYGSDGHFIKRLFDREFVKGLTEFIDVSSKLNSGTQAVLLNSNEGMRYFRISVK
jgi:hypothetical protein